MFGKRYIVALLILFCFYAEAQDCLLGIGGNDAETIVDIFQLNENQRTTMNTLQEELDIEIKGINEQIEKLLAEHPQSKDADLIVLADKYKVLRQKILDASYRCDKALLATFNTKQYDRYLELCREAIRRPIAIIPKTYDQAGNPE
ncbi:hypothetical protein [Pareuzebyella sediminis]|uniref:hypothetical protein n=1 Tax=Pareuzebyella sediminis TaxID=2607998 RepID=UPI0011EC8D27|nr:hypothetical protein [Pareuzebyella sediminis]